MAFQYPLNFRLRDEATLARFVAGANAELVDRLRGLHQQSGPLLMVITGLPGSGRTHLLQAVVRDAADAIYLPLKDIEGLQTEMFDGLESRRLVCLDDADMLAGTAELELALFSLINRLREAGHMLLISLSCALAECPFELKDLVSRLAAGLNYRLQPLDEDGKREFLQADARNRGLEIGEDVASYILNHWPRDMHSLCELLNRLDRESLRTQRRITVPFVRGMVEE